MSTAPSERERLEELRAAGLIQQVEYEARLTELPQEASIPPNPPPPSRPQPVDDIGRTLELVCAQCFGASNTEAQRQQAEDALERFNGDIVEAIMSLTYSPNQ
eukprot:TRINITY_DN2137_c0_g1_i3.p1 TRINITY_DN2137_c0_g1~~TRINITY_DN2137_c0_g1_i3.p1  ORF type:complete len:103 (+),score=18.72 TRINITY_DN2137_c0_g1_i3:369-677(+)